MNFDFSAEQYEFRDAFRDYLARDYPLAAHVRQATDYPLATPLWAGLSGMGLFGMLVPEAHGGLGLGFIDLALVLEELGRSLATPAAADTLAATDLLVRYGTPAQQACWLPGIASGTVRVALAVAEDGAGHGLDGLVTSARPIAGGYRLDGTKLMVAEAATADLLLVVARLPSQQQLSVFALPRDATGIALRPHTTLDIGARYVEVTLSSVHCDANALIGEVGAADRLYDTAAAIAAIELVGIGQQMLRVAVEYAKQREQFGRPIGSFQAIKHRCADMAVAVDAAASAAYFAAWAIAESPHEAPRAVSIAKSFCGDAARAACNGAIQVHGGIGFTWDLGLH